MTTPKQLSKLIDWAGVKLNGTQINLDIVNGCCLACPSCAVGSIATKRKGIMMPDLFKRILDKAEREFKIRRVQLYMYSDPCLHPHLHLFLEECRNRKIKTWLSTMLQSTACDFEKVIEARPTEFRISFPGWDKMRYYQSARADPKRFNRKIEEVCALPRYPETTWTLIFHHYRDNGHEEPRARELAAKHNLKFVRIGAIFMPLEKYVEQDYSEADKELISHLWESPEDAAKTMKRTETCMLWKQISLDANGDVFLCQLVYQERFKLVNFLDVPYRTIHKMLKTHKFCGKCLKMGGNILQECYSEIDKYDDPVGHANKKRRKW